MLTFQFNPYSELTTSRFLLRAPVLSDAPEFVIMRSDPLVNQFLDRPPTVTIEAAEKFLGMIMANISTHKSMYWVITEKDHNRPIGTICFWNLVPELDEAEIGYELQSAFFRKGVMQEVIPEVLRFGFEVMQLRKITALPFDANERSIKLLERFHFTIDDALRQRLEKEEDMTRILCYSLTNDKV